MDKKVRLIMGAALAAFAVILAVYAFSSKGGSGEISGVYENELSPTGEDDENVIFRMAFDKGTMTYVLEVEAQGTVRTFDSGTFAFEEGGTVHTFSETDDVFSQRYIMDGEYILADGNFYEPETGALSSGDTFEGAYTLKAGEAGQSSVTFYEDGTFEDNTAEGEKINGTYERDGDLIYCRGEDGKPVKNFYIYGDRLTTSFYKKVKKI